MSYKVISGFYAKVTTIWYSIAQITVNIASAISARCTSAKLIVAHYAVASQKHT